ncbi:OsmC family protein [Streptococcus moroccensis]|uniref:Organic hydroperoxide reductase OsmC/OhrA n=1 Tax=Streptococcus moroccensis TaxID=1451356 RepID=A0ABT9YU09_9STRE|nr:OsmC family protein [Streptococcus moroccensis]MDQ0223071.1 organic hydroperoxide reductase OsmC/OhrA [Streptococcus moroccensis]
MSLYSVSSHNNQGIDGTVRLSNGKTVATNHPLNDQPGFNPEELIALAWSTCLKATLDAVLEAKSMSNHSYVEVHVDLEKEPTTPGYFFAVRGQASIQGLSLDEADILIQEAHARCPVSKLIGQANSVTLETVAYVI